MLANILHNMYHCVAIVRESPMGAMGGHYIIDTAIVAILHSFAYWDKTRLGAFGVCRFVADSTYKAIL